MGIFSSLFGSGDQQGKDTFWQKPKSEADIEALFRQDQSLRIIYKHSFSCGICIMAKSRLDAAVEELSGKAELYFIDVKADRPLSNLVAEKSGVRHESPQVLLLYNGQVFSHASHGDVRPDSLLKDIKEAAG